MRLNQNPMNISTPVIIAGSLWAMLNVAQAAGDPETGRYAFSTCSGCHAIPGYTNVYPTYHVPRIGGQHPEYIISALKSYKDGLRDHQTMHANAASLSEEDMANIAAYVNTFEPSDETGPIKSGDAQRGKEKSATCVACHGEDGNNPDPNFPRLAGQFQDYLLKSLQDYQSGARDNAIMKGMVATLSDEDMADLAAYYASQTPALAIIEYSGSD